MLARTRRRAYYERDILATPWRASRSARPTSRSSRWTRSRTPPTRELRHGGGVAGAIVRAGGRSIQEESDRQGADRARRGGRDGGRGAAGAVGDPRRDDGAGRPDLGGHHPPRDREHAREGGRARRAVAGAGRVRHGRRRLPGRRGGAHRGRGGAPPPRRGQRARAGRVRGLRRRGARGVRASARRSRASDAAGPRRSRQVQGHARRRRGGGSRSGAGSGAAASSASSCCRSPTAARERWRRWCGHAAAGSSRRRRTDPLGRAVEAAFGLLDGGSVAVVEQAQASGLWRVRDGRARSRWPPRATAPAS